MSVKPKMRGHGDGSYRKKGVVDERHGLFRWELRASVTVPSGETKRVSEMFSGTEKDAKKRLAEIRVNGERFGLADGNVTFGAVLDAWKKNMAANVSEGSRRRYVGAATRYVEPRWANVKVKTITQGAVSLWYTHLRETLGHSSVRMIHTVMSGVLEFAFSELALVPANPVANLKLKMPKDEREKKEVGVKSLTPVQAGAFYQTAISDRGGAPLAFALLTGARIGEVLALRWSCVNLDTGVVSIEVTRSGGESGGVYENAPKSKAGRRKIRCQGQALELLKSQWARREEERAAHLPLWQDTDYVFFTLRGTAYRPDGIKRYMERVCRNAGIKRMNVHRLRHTAASLMLMGGANIAAVSKHLGHSRVSITLDVYRHVMDDEMDGLTLNLG